MIKIIFFLLSFTIIYAIPTINIDSENIKIEDFSVEYFIDQSKKIQLSDVKSQKFTKDTNKLSLGGDKVHTWIRFNIHNSTEKHKEFFLHNKLAFLSLEINFYELKNEQIINSTYINLTNHEDGSIKKMYGTDSIFSITLDANETKTIYIKNTMSVTQLVYLTIYDEKSSKKSLLKKDDFVIILLGMLLALVFYHLILYFSTGYREYIYYSLYLISATLWQSLLSGVLTNNFSLYFTSQNKYFLISVILLPIFLTLFTKTILHTAKDYQFQDKLLNSIIFLFFLTTVIVLLIDIDFALNIVKFLYVYMFTIILFTTYKIMKDGNQIAKIFLWGNSFFVFFTLITDLYYSGFINYSYFIFNAAYIGIVIEALILSYIITYRIKLLQENEIQSIKGLANKNEIEKMNTLLQLKVQEGIRESREKDKIMFQQNKLISMGEMIENIAHQWRQPLTEVNASVSEIDTIIYEKYKSDTEIEKELVNIENLTSHMSKTIDSFQGFFDKTQKKREFSLRGSIYDSVVILGKALDDSKIIINIDIEKEFLYTGYENELKQVILILLNNAKDALLLQNSQHPKINIKITQDNTQHLISICDNAGGIKDTIIDKIFEPYFTTKHKTQGRGLGLYISKIIIEDKMSGKISINNTTKGACFTITLKERIK